MQITPQIHIPNAGGFIQEYYSEGCTVSQEQKAQNISFQNQYPNINEPFCYNNIVFYVWLLLFIYMTSIVENVNQD